MKARSNRSATYVKGILNYTTLILKNHRNLLLDKVRRMQNVSEHCMRISPGSQVFYSLFEFKLTGM